MTPRNTIRSLAGLAGALASLSLQAQNPIADLGGSTLTKKMTFAVYDIRAPEASVGAIQDATLRAIRLYARDATLQEGLVATPYPAYPGRLQLQETGGTPRPLCPGAVFIISGMDTSMTKYGELVFHHACLFPYSAGYRINYFAIYGQRSGAGSSNPNVLAAMMGRALGGLVGLGDIGSSINTVMDRMESNLKAAALPFKLVELRPKDLPGRVVEADDLPRPDPAALAPAAAPATMVTPIATAAPSAATALPPEIQGTEMGRVIVQLHQQQEAARAQFMAQRQGPGVPAVPVPAPLAAGQPAATEPGTQAAALAARKELTAIGLQYHSQEQFMAAIHRGDLLAVKLFVAGQGVSLTAPDATGQTPLALARAQQRTEIVTLLTGAAAGAGTVR